MYILVFNTIFVVKFDAVKSLGMQWSFSNKGSNLPQFLSFKNTHDDRSRNTLMDPVASSGYMTISTKDAFDSNQKSFLGVTQVCLFLFIYLFIR
jgi:jasmonate ZIM domain-containing protein